MERCSRLGTLKSGGSEPRDNVFLDLPIYPLTSSECFLCLDSLRCLTILSLPKKLGRNLERRKVLEQT